MSRIQSLRDTHLADFAEHGEGVASVIVEAKRTPVAPSPTVAARRTSTDARDALPPAAGKRAVTKRAAPVTSMGELEAALRKMGLGDRARRNELAGSFALEVTPSELRQLAGIPAVQAIRSNRFRRVA